MIMARVVVGVGVLVLVAVGIGACGGSPYYLPAPSQVEQRDAAVDPSEQAKQEQSRDLQARTALLELYESLSKERFEDAEQLLSQQTRDFLAYGTETGDPSTVLSSGTLVIPDGRSVEFEPVELLIGGEIQSITDSMDGAQEHETRSRRELFVVDPAGQAHQVVMISEGGRWVLHRTSINPGQE
jgi:hypothetical protein